MKIHILRRLLLLLLWEGPKQIVKYNCALVLLLEEWTDDPRMATSEDLWTKQTWAEGCTITAVTLNDLQDQFLFLYA